MQYRVSYGRSDGFQLGPIGYIIGINLILLIVTLIVPSLKIDLGLIPALFPERWWPIFTSMFIHDGIWHFFMNMLTLFFFGNSLIRLIGTRNFLFVYFLAGLVGNLFYLWMGEPISVAYGASGAVFGIAGALAVLRPKLKVFIMFIPIPVPLWIAGIIFFVLLSLPWAAGNVAWQAHLGGLVLGVAAGFLFRKRPRLYY